MQTEYRSNSTTPNASAIKYSDEGNLGPYTGQLPSSHLLFFKKQLSSATVYNVHTHRDTMKCYGDKL